MSRPLYAVVRVLATVWLGICFRLEVSGTEHVPAEGAAIVAPNHKSFLDPFFVGLAVRRPVRFLAKAELFRGPLGWLLPRLGAFPVRRGAADAAAMRTARAILSGGGLLVVFPEGTRVLAADALGSPHHGAGRLALETGAPIVPAAITGTAHLWLGPVPKPRRIHVSFATPIDVADVAPGPDAVFALIDERVWPSVREEYGRLQATPGLIAAGLATIGIGGLAARRRRRASQAPRLLGKVEPVTWRQRLSRRSPPARLRPWRR